VYQQVRVLKHDVHSPPLNYSIEFISLSTASSSFLDTSSDFIGSNTHLRKRRKRPVLSNNNDRAWDCACMFNNPQAAAVCFWCKAPRPGYEDARQPQGQTNSQSSSIQQEAAAMETSTVTAATGPASAVKRTGTQEGQIRCLAWHCKCSFINPGTAILCFWCEAPQPGYAEDGKPLGDNKEPSTGTQGGVSAVVTAGGSTGTLCGRAQGTSTNDMLNGLEKLTKSGEDTTNEKATAKAETK
jgi:hypothetical protein